jgi:hypothetical protein
MAAVESTALAAAGFDGEVFGVDERGFLAALAVLRLALEGLAIFFRATLRGAFPFVLFLAIARLYEAIRPRATYRGQRAAQRRRQGERGGSPARGAGVALRLSQSTRGRTPSGTATSSRSTVCRRSLSSTVTR